MIESILLLYSSIPEELERDLLVFAAAAAVVAGWICTRLYTGVKNE